MRSLIFLLLVIFSSAIAQAEITVASPDNTGIVCSDLLAGQSIDVGDVCVTATPDGLCLQYITTGDWYIDETHLWVGLNIAEMPQNRKGNPKIGLFPYGGSADPGATQSVEICVPYSDLGLSEAIICELDQLVLFAAHAAVYRVVDGEVVQTETGWADGDPIVDKGSWGMFGNVTLTCDNTEPPVYDDCETAFAFGNTELDDLPDPLNPDQPLTARWGWQIGPLLPGDEFVTPIYSGAGQNDITKGTHVGDLTIRYEGQEVFVTYSMLPGFIMTETHLYVGSTDIETAAPGQFGYDHENLESIIDTYTVTVGQPEPPVYIVAHAVVCAIVN